MTDHKPTMEDFLDEDGVLTDDYWDEDHAMVVQFKKGFDPRELEGVEETTGERIPSHNGFLYEGLFIGWDKDHYRAELMVPFDWMDYDRDELLQREVENNHLEMEWIDIENSGLIIG